MSSAIQSTVIEYLDLRNKYPIQISQDDVNLFIRLHRKTDEIPILFPVFDISMIRNWFLCIYFLCHSPDAQRKYIFIGI